MSFSKTFFSTQVLHFFLLSVLFFLSLVSLPSSFWSSSRRHCRLLTRAVRVACAPRCSPCSSPMRRPWSKTRRRRRRRRSKVRVCILDAWPRLLSHHSCLRCFRLPRTCSDDDVRAALSALCAPSDRDTPFFDSASSSSSTSASVSPRVSTLRALRERHARWLREAIDEAKRV